MKTNIEVNYYNWTDSYEVHVYCTGTEYMVILYGDTTNTPYEWQIQNIDYSNVPPDNNIQDLTKLTEEEYFQHSTAWDMEPNFYLVHAIQQHIIDHKHTWTNDTFYSIDLEY
jgi:Tfp pilus tip-associated adhesin PilY1